MHTSKVSLATLLGGALLLAACSTTGGEPEELPSSVNLRLVSDLTLDDENDDFRRGKRTFARFNEGEPGVHFLCRAPSTEGRLGEESVYLSQVVAPLLSFDRLVASWNVDVPAGFGFRVEVRVGHETEGSWSPFLFLGEWGDAVIEDERVVEFDAGRVDVDLVVTTRRFDRLQYRVRAVRGIPEEENEEDLRGPVLRRFAVIVGDSTGRARYLDHNRPRPRSFPPDSWKRRLDVPFLSQRDADPEIAHRLCSPTSLAMVLAYRGVETTPEEVAERVYDPLHDIYGNWPRAIQTAFEYGVPGYLQRFDDWHEVRRMIAFGQPLIISIKAAEGELEGAPYEQTDGHLLVLCGFDEDGDVLVNDPAAETAEGGQLTYSLDDLSRVWLMNGGLAYVLLPTS